MGKLSAGQWLCRCRDSRSALPNDVPRLTDEVILIKAPSSVICFANATFPVNGEGLKPSFLSEASPVARHSPFGRTTVPGGKAALGEAVSRAGALPLPGQSFGFAE